MLERVLNTPKCIVIKKNLKIKPYQYQSFFSKYTFPDSLQLSQKQTNLKKHSLTKNFFRLNIFAIYFPVNLIFFTAQMYPFD